MGPATIPMGFGTPSFVFFFGLNHPISGNRIGPRLIRIRGVVTVKALYPSQMVCLVRIEPESSSHLPSLRRQLSHNPSFVFFKSTVG